MRFITFKQMKEEWRFPFTRVHTMRLVKEGKFPTPYTMGGRHIVWDEDEFKNWLKSRRMDIHQPPKPPFDPNRPTDPHPSTVRL